MGILRTTKIAALVLGGVAAVVGMLALLAANPEPLTPFRSAAVLCDSPAARSPPDQGAGSQDKAPAVEAKQAAEGRGAAPGSAPAAGEDEAAPRSSAPPADRVQGLKACVRADNATFDCIREAHELPAGDAKFNFPHFMLVGWPKTATTSLYSHLLEHPEIIGPSKKEPEFLTAGCHFSLACGVGAQRDYLLGTLHMKTAVMREGLQRAAFEASTHYAQLAPLTARSLRARMPYLRIVLSFREPISRILSELVHTEERQGWGGREAVCLGRESTYACIRSRLLGLPGYAAPLDEWLRKWPRHQIHLIHYETLTSNETEAAELRSLQSFLGIDPYATGNHLVMRNHRKDRGAEEGWPIGREEYAELVALARKDAAAVAELVTRYRVGKGTAWLASWEATWQATLDNCDDGTCHMHPT